MAYKALTDLDHANEQLALVNDANVRARTQLAEADKQIAELKADNARLAARVEHLTNLDIEASHFREVEHPDIVEKLQARVAALEKTERMLRINLDVAHDEIEQLREETP